MQYRIDERGSKFIAVVFDAATGTVFYVSRACPTWAVALKLALRYMKLGRV